MGRVASLCDARPPGARLPRDRPDARPADPRGSGSKGGSRTGPSLIPLSVPEVRRLVLASVGDNTQRVFHLGWSRWRRAHQAIAQRCHRARRSQQETKPAVQPLVLSAASSALTDAQWERIRWLLPSQRPPTGRPRHDHRTVLGGILWVLRTASPWREMPARFGKWDTAYARYRLWCMQGFWPRLIDALGPAPLPPPAPVVAIGRVSVL